MKSNKKIIISTLVLIATTTLTIGCGKQEGVISKSVIQVPDIEGGLEGKGFTCTGLTYDNKKDVFYVGNIGKATPKTEGFKSTIVKVSKDFKRNLGEIKLYETFKEMSDIQGLTLDYSDDSFWFCSFSENKIRHITKDGKELGYVDFEKPTGIVYDNRTDSLWVLSYDNLVNIKKDGTVEKSIHIKEEGQDQLWLDETNNKMYITTGNNYKDSNYVFTVDLQTEEVKKTYTMADSYAVEGIHIEGNDMYILNDGYYHKGKVKTNQANIYDLSSITD